MNMSRRRRRWSALPLLLAVLLSGAAAADTPHTGAEGLGDRLFPGLGNGGYDVQHYLVDLRYPTGAVTDPIEGTVAINARATETLSRFDLDWGGGPVGGVTVDGRQARWSQHDEELVITPQAPLAAGHRFVV